MIFSQGSQKVENVYHCKATTTPITESSLDTLCGAFVDWFSTDGNDLSSNTAVLEKIVAKDLTSETGPAIEYTTGLPIAGAASGPASPMNVTAAVSFGTALRGRSYRGRVYHIGITSDRTTGNQLTSVYRGQLIEGYAGLISAVNTSGWDLCVVSRYHNKSPRTAGVATPITSVSVDINLDSQRRRLAGRGE
jgi:hypothetical protein